MAEKPTYVELLRRIRELEKAEYEGKQAEDKLQNRETIIQSIFDVTPVGICIMKDRVYQRANRFWCESFGYREKDIIGHTTAFLYETPEEYERVGNELYGDLVKNGIGSSRTRLKRSNGEIRGVDLIAKPLNPEDLESGTLVVVHDITERKRAQDALQESESRLRTIFDVSQAGIILATPQGVIAYANQGMAKMLVCTQQALIGSLYSDHLHPDQRIMGNRLMHQLIAGDIDSVACEQHYMRSDGKDFFGFLSGRRHENKQGKLISVVGIIADITEQKNLENQLRRASKMESIGTLAGGIAHNFNNILMGIQGRASLMMVGKDPSHPDVEHLKGIEEYVQSAAELTKDLLGFAKGGKYEVKLVDLNALIKNENEMFGCTKKEIQLYGKYEKDLWAVEADSGQVKQVLLNLYVNAWQAMPGGGELYVQTENVTIGEEYLKPFEIAPGKYVKISVTDTGTGIDDTIQEKIFDPFFSTRDKGQGTGLGLASVYGIIKNHGGFINVYSEKEAGTTFTIYLPASDKKLVKQGQDLGHQDIQYGEGTILLVDDEDLILEVGKKMLEILGYNVLVARNGKEALEVYEERQTEIDLVILDMIMPGMGGGETYDRLKTIDENVRGLLSSGYAINGQAKEILERGCKGFIQKPFSLNELSIKVREVLKETD